MKTIPHLLLTVFFSVVVFSGCVQNAKTEQSMNPPAKNQKNEPSPKLVDQEVELSCGQCLFGMKEEGCTLAIRLEGKSYFVEGSSIDDHGDAHADDGLCNCIKKAKVTGTIVGDKFKAESIKIVKAEPSAPADTKQKLQP